MREVVDHWLSLAGLENSEQTYFLVALSVILLTALVLHFVLHHVVVRFLDRESESSTRLWQKALFQHKLFSRLAFTLQGVVLYVQAGIWLDAEALVLPLLLALTQLWIIFASLLTLYSLLSTLETVLSASPAGNRIPLRGISQSIKLIAAVLAIILGVSLLIGKSPLILFSGLGAMTAVLLLVFKDPLLGLVAGIQLSANNMLRVGDWLEMPKFGADGDVIEISLTTVKVRNWDKTISTIPTYALISDSFKNWRGMAEAGGRRIKRAVNIDATSVRFLDEEDLERLRRLQLITDYIENKVKEVEEDNRANGVSRDSPANGRRLTNLGTFRAYLTAYLKKHKRLHPGLTQMVRQLAPGPEGVPLEIYAFTNDTEWVIYEGIQADIFDHVFAVIPEFGLRLHQAPGGYDMRQIGVATCDKPDRSGRETGT